MDTINTIALSVIDAFSTKNADGTITGFDFVGFDKAVTMLCDHRAKIRGDVKEAEKKASDAEKASKAEKGKAYYKSLKVGDEFSVEIGGNIVKVRKISTKSGSDASAACELVVSAGGKTDKRYPKFDKVVVA